ncbi:histidine phosphatase family protein [Pradoshia sp.]|uniref:histidine phosphatase family protein n=1 Tax=Pradoshia sp. TaxID=2651281 RepID=UPI003F06A30A
MLTIYLTRHGLTEWNVNRRMQGWGNGELTEKGIRDAKALGNRLADTTIDKVYSSSSKRAYETAQYIIGDREISLIQMDDLREMNFGDWDGRIREEVEAEYPEDFKTFWEKPHLYDRNSGETFEHVRKRAVQAFERIIEENKEGTILIVTHSIFLRVLMTYIKDIPLSDVFKATPPGNTSLAKVEVENGQLNLIFENDMQHVE